MFIEAGICLMTEGGWFDLAFIYSGLLSDFLNRLYFLVARISVTFR